jgi:acetyltransferase-like isoleucine patch superfamily enzyme
VSELRLRERLFTAAVRRSFDSFGRGSSLAPPVRISGEDCISIGRSTRAGRGAWIQVIAGPGGVGRGRIEVGDDVVLEENTVLSSAVHVRLGNRVFVGRHTYVSDHRHAYGAPDVPILQQGDADFAPTIVEDDVVIGPSCAIGSGLTIGRGAVILPFAVVKHDVRPGTTYEGVQHRSAR